MRKTQWARGMYGGDGQLPRSGITAQCAQIANRGTFFFFLVVAACNSANSHIKGVPTDMIARRIRVKWVGRNDGACCFCSFLVVLACENDTSYFSLFSSRERQGRNKSSALCGFSLLVSHEYGVQSCHPGLQSEHTVTAYYYYRQTLS